MEKLSSVKEKNFNWIETVDESKIIYADMQKPFGKMHNPVGLSCEKKRGFQRKEKIDRWRTSVGTVITKFEVKTWSQKNHHRPEGWAISER